MDLIELIVIERARVGLREFSWANNIQRRKVPGTTGGLERAEGWHEVEFTVPGSVAYVAHEKRRFCLFARKVALVL
jgi:hypothetical protein